uniref:DUF2202 domain-containing protein n=1 Tax=Caldisericum exile TaxID=693075 RepID=A0A7C4TX43_9BACT
MEEIDIANLKIYEYSNPLQGSENHLRAFVSQLSSRGVNYTPSVITLDKYNNWEHNRKRNSRRLDF